VRDKRIEFESNSEEENIVIDSGTTLTFFPDDVYTGLESAMVDEIDLERVDGQISLKLCYKIQRDQQY